MSMCNNCGAALGPGQAKCSYCGTAAATSHAAPPAHHAPATTPPPSAAPAVQAGGPPKSKIAAGVLGILLGTLGVHNFYLGFTGKAVAQLLITILSCGYLSVVSFIWGLVEGIMILTGSINRDARGIPLQD